MTGYSNEQCVLGTLKLTTKPQDCWRNQNLISYMTCMRPPPSVVTCDYWAVLCMIRAVALYKWLLAFSVFYVVAQIHTCTVLKAAALIATVCTWSVGSTQMPPRPLKMGCSLVFFWVGFVPPPPPLSWKLAFNVVLSLPLWIWICPLLNFAAMCLPPLKQINPEINPEYYYTTYPY